MQEKLENILIEKERRLAAFLALDWSFYLLFCNRAYPGDKKEDLLRT